MKTIHGVFDPAHNSLNAIRLVLAVTVIVSHSWLVNGLGAPPMLNGTDPGLVAVAGFFAISGYLVTSSRLRSQSFLSYLWRRFLRIYPAFIAALVVTAFVFAPLSVWLYSPSNVVWSSAVNYVLSNAGLLQQQTVIDHTLINNAFPFVWNVPLWTLFYEAICYVLVGLIVSLVPRRVLARVLAALFVAVTVASAWLHLWPTAYAPPIAVNAVGLASFFFAGAVLFTYAQKIPASGVLATLAVALAVALAAVGLFEPLAAAPIAYALLYAGSVLPLTRFGSRNDVSYGLYIYGFPVQQLVVLVLGGALLPVWLMSLVSIIFTVPLAWASWLAIERPSMSHGRRLKDEPGRGDPSIS